MAHHLLLDRNRSAHGVSARKVRSLLAELQALQQFACETEGPGGAFRLHIGYNLLHNAALYAQR
jgi:hypothetical protein